MLLRLVTVDRNVFKTATCHSRALWGMITNKMRLLITIFLVTFFSDLFGQFDGYEFKRENLVGYNKITTTRLNYYKNDSTSYTSIYYVNDIGDIVKSEHFDESKISSWAKYEYSDSGLLKYQEVHNPTNRFDEKTNREIEEIKDDTYHGILFEYQDQLLTKQFYIDCYEGSKSSDRYTLYEYDKSGRITKEVTIDGSVGITGSFKPNSTVIDTMYYKDKTTSWTKIYTHKTDSIISSSYDESNEIQGYSFTKLGLNKKPIKILDTDPQRNGIKCVSNTYDTNGKLTHVKIEIIDIDKITYDMAAGDEYEIYYNDKSLPELGITKENGKVISKLTVQYK